MHTHIHALYVCMCAFIYTHLYIFKYHIYVYAYVFTYYIHICMYPYAHILYI